MFSSFQWDMPGKHHRARLIAIEQYRWFTAGADVSLTTNTHVQISDVQVGGRVKLGWSWEGCCSADGGLQKFGERRREHSGGEVHLEAEGNDAAFGISLQKIIRGRFVESQMER